VITGAPTRRAAMAAMAALAADLKFHSARGEGAVTEEPWSHDGLAGTLTLPKRAAARGPAVLIIAGSGPTDRDGNGPLISTDCYRLLAAGLAANGIRSLRYDKRGIGGSAGLMTREDDVRFDDFVHDAVAAARALARREDVSSVVIAGHSEGGLIALRAVHAVAVAGLVLLATPGRPFADLLRAQFRGAPMPEHLRAEALRIIDTLAANESVDDVPDELAPVFRASVQSYLRSVMTIDPRIEIAQVPVAVLLLYGGRDLQVPLEHRDLMAKAKPDARVVTVASANHVLKPSPAARAGNIATYTDRSRPLDPGIVPPIALFVEDLR
jgi:uncharacterized protein